jgi:hypothetical protein
MTTDTRRAPRRPVPEIIGVRDEMSGESLGRLGNVSENGMLLLANTALTVDALYQVSFPINDAHGVPVTMAVGVHLLWKEPANAPDQWWTGFRFLTISQDHLATLKQWIQAGLAGR